MRYSCHQLLLSNQSWTRVAEGKCCPSYVRFCTNSVLCHCHNTILRKACFRYRGKVESFVRWSVCMARFFFTAYLLHLPHSPITPLPLHHPFAPHIALCVIGLCCLCGHGHSRSRKLWLVFFCFHLFKQRHVLHHLTQLLCVLRETLNKLTLTREGRILRVPKDGQMLF